MTYIKFRDLIKEDLDPNNEILTWLRTSIGVGNYRLRVYRRPDFYFGVTLSSEDATLFRLRFDL